MGIKANKIKIEWIAEEEEKRLQPPDPKPDYCAGCGRELDEVAPTYFIGGIVSKILLINIDSKLPNLALKKIEKYYKDKGDEVIWNFPLLQTKADKIYVSCIFDWNKDKCKNYEGIADIGGSGYDLTKTLPDEIEKIKPRINYGFTTRGCIRNCPWCIVPQKEGKKIRVVGDLLDLWDGRSKDVVLIDNNILALPEHFKLICQQAISNKIRLDFNQGLDIRLLTDNTCRLLKSIKTKVIRFSWDNMKDEQVIKEKVNLLKKHDIKNCMFFILTNFNTSFDEDLYRRQMINSWKYDAFVMVYNQTKAHKLIKEFARWNNRFYFRNLLFNDYLKARGYENLYHKKDV